MESHRMSGSLDSRLQRGYTQQHSPRASPDSLFGVRVQVQGIKGHPYVVLNNGGQESHVDMASHNSEYNGAVVRGSPLGGTASDKTPANRLGQRGDSPSEARGSLRTASSNAFHYQRHPELLKPYDPENNNLNHVVPLQTASTARPEQLNLGVKAGKSQGAEGSKVRIPLPAVGPGLEQSDATMEALASATSDRSPNSVDSSSFSSVGKLIDRFNTSLQRGRCGPRNRLNLEDRKRSRSVESNRPSASSSFSSSSAASRASSVKGIRGETLGATCTADSPRARLLSGELTLADSRESSRSATQLFREQEAMEPSSPRPTNTLYRMEKTPLSTSTVTNQTDESDERDTQVTPDLLKGQQELPAEANEDAAKQVLFGFLKDGTTDNDSTTQRKVNLLLERINKLKWRTIENVEEEDKDCAAEVKALQDKGTSLEKEVAELKNQLQIETKNEKMLAKACEKARTERKNLQEELAKTQEELSALRSRLAEVEAELLSTKQELAQVSAERNRFKTEMKDLQQQLSEMHDELDQAKKTEVENRDKEELLKDMNQLRVDFQEILQVQEEQEEVLHWRERELNALKGALKEEVESHDKDMAILKEQYDQEVQKLQEAMDEVKERTAMLGQEKVEAEEERGAAKAQLMTLTKRSDQLKRQVEELEATVDVLHQTIQESKAREKLLEQRANQLEREKEHVEETLTDVRTKEEELCQCNQALAVRLEDVQIKLTKLNHEHRELKERLREERGQLEELQTVRRELEEERRLQDRTVEQLQRKMCNIVEECEVSTDKLQNQIDEARERSGRELAELQRQLQEKGVELDKSRLTVKKLQEELLPLEEDLRRCRREQQEATLRSRQLQQKMEEVEDRSYASVDERDRQIKLMEGRIGQLEEDLNEERSTADRLMERLDKTKEQMDQIRNELLQEKSVRQDLECDKTSLERQNKDLRSRVSTLEGSQRPNQDAVVTRLNSRIQELEERLLVEEKENNNLQQTNRKLERKMKEMKMQVDDEHTALQSQRDQLTQRLKTVKRQMDEAEEEMERLEHAKKKLQRDLDEQLEANEALHGQISTLRSEMRRKRKSSPLMKITEDGTEDVEDLSSD